MASWTLPMPDGRRRPCGGWCNERARAKVGENNSLTSQSADRWHGWRPTCPDDKRAHGDARFV